MSKRNTVKHSEKSEKKTVLHLKMPQKYWEKFAMDPYRKMPPSKHAMVVQNYFH